MPSIGAPPVVQHVPLAESIPSPPQVIAAPRSITASEASNEATPEQTAQEP
jgi:hypothetical protein